MQPKAQTFSLEQGETGVHTGFVENDAVASIKSVNTFILLEETLLGAVSFWLGLD